MFIEGGHVVFEHVQVLLEVLLLSFFITNLLRLLQFFRQLLACRLQSFLNDLLLVLLEVLQDVGHRLLGVEAGLRV